MKNLKENYNNFNNFVIKVSKNVEDPIFFGKAMRCLFEDMYKAKPEEARIWNKLHN